MERKHKSNADRQRAYRERKRNAIRSVTPDRPEDGVTSPSKDRGRYLYLGNWGRGNVYALDVTGLNDEQQAEYIRTHPYPG